MYDWRLSARCYLRQTYGGSDNRKKKCVTLANKFAGGAA